MSSLYVLLYRHIHVQTVSHYSSILFHKFTHLLKCTRNAQISTSGALESLADTQRAGEI